jgi:putative aldouronate transport system permease protein
LSGTGQRSLFSPISSKVKEKWPLPCCFVPRKRDICTLKRAIVPIQRMEKSTMIKWKKALPKKQNRDCWIGGIVLEKQIALNRKSLPQSKGPGFWYNARKSIMKHWQLHLLVLPPLLFFLIFKYYPMVNAVLAFKDYNVIKGIWGSPWVGFKNFSLFFENPQFWTLVKNTIMLSGYQLLAGFPIPIILALMINEVRGGRFKKFVQLVSFAPYFISTVVMVSIVMMFLAPRLGFANVALNFFGMESINFLGEPSMFRSIYVWSDIWQTAGYSAVVYLAALAGIDPTLYEAAKVDGASRFQKIRHVDLPGIVPTIVIILILNVGNVMAIGFEKVYLLQNPLNLANSEIIATYVYRVGLLNANYSFATAVGLFNSVINLILLFTVNGLAKRITKNSIW